MSDELSHKDENVIKLGVRFKKPQSKEKMLTIVKDYGGCREHSYLIDAEADEVSCANCDKKLNPMRVLVDLAQTESLWMLNHKRYTDEVKRLDEKCRTK